MHLLLIEDFIKRQPEKRQQLLDDEVRARERELLLYTNIYGLVRFHGFAALRLIIGTGISVFVFVWSLSQLAQFGQTLARITSLPLGLPAGIGKYFFSSSTQLFVPGSYSDLFIRTFHGIDWRDAATIGFVVSLVLLIEKSITGYLALKESRRLKQGERELRAELMQLLEWRKQGE